MSEKGRPAVGAAGGGRDLRAAGGLSRTHGTTGRDGRQGPQHGRIICDVWRKTVRGSAHRLRVPPAWALDEADLDAAEAMGARVLCLRDLESLHHYWTALSTIRQKGFRLDRGHGEQIALPLPWWRPTRAGAEALGEELREPEPAAVQTPMFGGVL